MIKMKSQLEKHKGKSVLLEIGEESNIDKLEEEEMIRELQEKVRHLELKQKRGFEKLRKSVAPTTLVISFGQDQVVFMEEDIVE